MTGGDGGGGGDDDDEGSSTSDARRSRQQDHGRRRSRAHGSFAAKKGSGKKKRKKGSKLSRIATKREVLKRKQRRATIEVDNLAAMIAGAATEEEAEELRAMLGEAKQRQSALRPRRRKRHRADGPMQSISETTGSTIRERPVHGHGL